VRRGRPPFEGCWALPGGFCEWKETTEDCCVRETLEETGLTVRVAELRGVYSKPDRDPRGHNVTVVYAVKLLKGRARGGDDAAEARWFEPGEVAKIRFAFDHRAIVREQFARDRRKRRPRARGSSASLKTRGRAGLRS
jgi:8-oxo-dGTP diphosphatase